MSQHLFEEFNPVSVKAWKQKIQADLKGENYNDLLIWKTQDGIDIKPFYHQEEMDQELIIKPISTPWLIGQQIFVNDAKKSNIKAIKAIKSGVESLIFIIPEPKICLNELIKNIDDLKIKLHFKFLFLDHKHLKNLNKYNPVNSNLSIDIIGNLAKTGNWYNNLNDDFQKFDVYLKTAKQFSINGILYQNAGASIIQQLAYSLSQANEYLNHIDHDTSLNSIFREETGNNKIIFNMAIGSNYFFEIAKLKALRLLWTTLVDEYQFAISCEIVATPTKRNKTLYDYNTNMLRTTTECMSAVLGGANIIYNLPYDAIYHKENEFGERISRNQLLVLKYESYFNAVTNVSDGSYYIEYLTRQFAKKALILFKDIEKNGGFLKQLKNHTIQKKIKESALKEQELFDSKKKILLGTNKYINPKDRMKDELERYPFLKRNTRKTLIEPIFEKRLAEALEQERLKSEH